MCDWGFIVPVVAALCFVVLGGLFYKINFIDDEGNMDGSIRTGRDKTDADCILDAAESTSILC